MATILLVCQTADDLYRSVRTSREPRFYDGRWIARAESDLFPNTPSMRFRDEDGRPCLICLTGDPHAVSQVCFGRLVNSVLISSPEIVWQRI